MVENTSKMMLRASKIDQGKAKKSLKNFEEILKNFHLFGFCNLDFATLHFCHSRFGKAEWGSHQILISSVIWLPLPPFWLKKGLTDVYCQPLCVLCSDTSNTLSFHPQEKKVRFFCKIKPILYE